MSLLGLKQTLSAFNYVRTVTTTTGGSGASTTTTASANTNTFVTLRVRNKPSIIALHTNKHTRWRLIPCAHLLAKAAHDRDPPNDPYRSNQSLGFVSLKIKSRTHQHQNSLNKSSPMSSPSTLSFTATRSASSDSSRSSAASGVSDMGSEGKAPLGSCFDNHSVSPSMQKKQQGSDKLLTLPTILTLGRVAAVPVLVSTFYMDGWWGTFATTSIFIAAAITDWLDGYLARKMKLKSTFGAFLDPVADKLMVAAALILLCSRPLDVSVFGGVAWLLTLPSIAIIGREITMSAVREWAASQNTGLLGVVAVNNLGKWKTATQMTALTILLATRDGSLGGPPFLVDSGVVMLYISAGLAVWSLVVYMRKIWSVLLK